MFVAMLFAAAAVLMCALALADAGIVRDPAAAWSLASTLLGSFGARMAAVFALAASPLRVMGISIHVLVRERSTT
jgi:hypothetical protein